MIRTDRLLRDKKQTVDEIKRIAGKYTGDLNNFSVNYKNNILPLSRLSKDQFFEFVKKIRYRKDKSPIEIVVRPKHLLKNVSLGADCKKKSTLCATYFEANKIPYRLIGSSKRPDKKIHHIFPQIKNGNTWKNFDATYSHYKMGEPKIVTKIEIL